MSCQNYRLEITSLLDESLASDEFQLKAHMSSCGACSAFYREQVELDRFLGDPNFALDVPVSLWDTISERIEGPGPNQNWLDSLRNWFLAWEFSFAQAAGMAALLLLSLGLFQLPAAPNTRLLAQLDDYSLATSQQGNPFLLQAQGGNPFLSPEFSSDRGNPFAALGRRP